MTRLAIYAGTFDPLTLGHWDLVDCVAVVSRGHKKTSSTQGQSLRIKASASAK